MSMIQRAKKRGLTLEQHIELGCALSHLRDQAFRVVETHTVSSRESRAAERLLRAIEKVRLVMDSEVFRAVPREFDPRDLTIRIYYGGRLQRVPMEPDPDDAFSGWDDPSRERICPPYT